MLTRARSIFSRIFSSDPTPSSQIRFGETFDTINDSSSNDNNSDDNNINYNLECSINNNNNDNESLTKENNKRQINEYVNNNSIQTKSNVHYIQSHEKSKQNRLINSMQIATSRCNIESMKRLLNNFDIDINHRDQYGMSYVEHAILMSNFDMIDLLVRYGCDLHQGNSTGHSYLYVAIEITTNKSLEIIRLLLESNCSCLRSLDIISLTSPTQINYINSQDFILLNTHLLLIFKYHIRRMVLTDLLNLLSYLILTNLLVCKNDEYYGLDLNSKTTLNQFNNDYISLFIKTLGMRHISKLEYKIQNLQTLPISSMIPLTNDDIQPYINQIENLTKQVFELKHLCRFLIRQHLKNLKASTIATLAPTTKLQDYLLYTPI
ncbi:unnamed protein product [Adineta steineri]|uniref:SOCS box domain-containing protein n=1 Tax=Adineta steineri TaxID=433720 RepID=A0A818NT11_9BILA|nr:unnamed protein product [Adineta steineri]